MSVLLVSSLPPFERVEGLKIGNFATYLRIDALTEEAFLRELADGEFRSVVGHRPLALYLSQKLGREVNYVEDDFPLRMEYTTILFVAQVRGLRLMEESVPVEEQIGLVKRAMKTFYRVSNATIMTVDGPDDC